MWVGVSIHNNGAEVLFILFLFMKKKKKMTMLKARLSKHTGDASHIIQTPIVYAKDLPFFVNWCVSVGHNHVFDTVCVRFCGAQRSLGRHILSSFVPHVSFILFRSSSSILIICFITISFTPIAHTIMITDPP